MTLYGPTQPGRRSALEERFLYINLITGGPRLTYHLSSHACRALYFRRRGCTRHAAQDLLAARVISLQTVAFCSLNARFEQYTELNY